MRLARPTEWVKNLAVFAGPAFGLRLLEPTGFIHALEVFVAFCLASSASYAINDTLDRRADARHPTKRNRPVACGAIRPAAALVFGGVLVISGVVLSSLWLPREATLLVVLYFVLILAYSLALKNRMILDVIVIAVGFVLRASAGAAAVEVYISPWLIVCTFMICMFIGFGKRRCELATFGNTQDAREHRRTLLRYTPELLNHLISVTAGIAIITFVLYTMIDTGARQPPFPKQHLLYTLPLVVYGVFRYAMLTQTGKLHGPTQILLQDRPFLGTVVLWGLIAAAVVYEDRVRELLGW